MDMLDRPVEDGIAERGEPSAAVPVFDGELAGDQRGASSDASQDWPVPEEQGLMLADTVATGEVQEPRFLEAALLADVHVFDVRTAVAQSCELQEAREATVVPHRGLTAAWRGDASSGATPSSRQGQPMRVARGRAETRTGRIQSVCATPREMVVRKSDVSATEVATEHAEAAAVAGPRSSNRSSRSTCSRVPTATARCRRRPRLNTPSRQLLRQDREKRGSVHRRPVPGGARAPEGVRRIRTCVGRG